MIKLCQHVLAGKGISDEWKTNVVLPIYKVKGDVMNCESYKRIKLLEVTMKIVKKVLEKRIWNIINLDELQFGFMLRKGKVDAHFVLKRMKEY